MLLNLGRFVFYLRDFCTVCFRNFHCNRHSFSVAFVNKLAFGGGVLHCMRVYACVCVSRCGCVLVGTFHRLSVKYVEVEFSLENAKCNRIRIVFELNCAIGFAICLDF